MTAPLQYGTPAASDPTAVMGRRTLAWIADLLLYLAVVAAGFASMGEYVDVPAGIDDPCQELQDRTAATGEDIGACLDFRDMGIEEAEDRVYLLDTDESGVQTLLSLGWLAFFIVLQGLTGGSPGKLVFGLRVVDHHGARCGIGKSLGRTLMWIVDAAPWIIPLVGPITAFTSTGHRRVGDLAAGTYVVSASSVGRPVLAERAPLPAGQPAWGSGPPAAPPPAGQGWQTAPPRDGRWESPAADAEADLDFRTLEVPQSGERIDEEPPTVHADPDWSRSPDLDVTSPPAVPEAADPGEDWQPPTSPSADWSTDAPQEPAPAPEPPPFAAPGSEGPPSAPPESAPPGPPASAPRYDLPPPQWDAARGTYIQWEPNRQAWLEWDASGARWKPIDT